MGRSPTNSKTGLILGSSLQRLQAYLIAVLPGLVLLTGIVALAFAINSFVPAASPIAVAVLFGLMIGNFLGWPAFAKAGTDLAAKRFLRIGVVLLGLQISFLSLREIGVPGLAVVLLVVFGTFFGIQLLGRIFKVDEPLRLVIGAGFAICGVTAVAAVSPVARANKAQVSYAVALVALFGTLSIAVFPAVAGALSLNEVTAGSWVGAGVHDVAQVVATASVIGPAALDAAIVVKLTRVLMLVFVVLLVAWLAGKSTEAQAKALPLSKKWRTFFPPFILFFLVAIVIGNSGWLSESWLDAGVLASRVFLTFGCAALGVGVSWVAIRAVGARPLIVGSIAWVLVASLALVGVIAVGL